MATIDVTRTNIHGLQLRTRGRVVTPGEAGWDEARQAFNLTLDQQPSAIASPVDERDVASVIRFARDHGMRVAPQGPAHNAGPLASLEDTVLLKTSALQGVSIDAAARTARVRAGARWADVVPRASEMGLSALHGSSPTVGVIGYSLGGGMGWQARKHGLQTNHVTAIELVTADGDYVRADHDTEADLFWALRGGGGNFGVVTAMEFELFPLEEVYAGAMFWPAERAAEILHAWNELLPGMPEEVTSVGRVLSVPPLPDVPEPLRGRSFVIVEAAFLGSEADGRSLLAPLRDLGPEMDTFAMVPPAGLSNLHMDPEEPMPFASGHKLLHALPADGIDALVDVAGPESGTALLGVELRHTGGALARREPGHGANASLPGELSMFAGGLPLTPEMGAAVNASLERLNGAMAPWFAGLYANFVEEAADAADFYDEATFDRLVGIRAAVDPNGLFVANHPIPLADS
jgi:FAD/FMN-containing dehydrogenase